jgi:hypothetical protein
MACTDEVEKPSIWGVYYSRPEAAAVAAGIVEKKNGGTRLTLSVQRASVRHIIGEEYLLSYYFSSSDSLTLGIIKRTTDFNFNYALNDNGNEIKYAKFNSSVLALSSTQVLIQPKTAENKFETVLNIHTIESGDFLGTVSGVPLLKN